MRAKQLSLMAIGNLWTLAWLLAGSAQAADGCPSPTQPVAEIVSAQGTVELNDTPAELNQLVCEGDSIRVGARSRAAIALLDTEAVVRIDQNSELRVLALPQEDRSVLDLFMGVIHSFSRVPRALEVLTPFVNAAVEGTEFLVRVDEVSTFISVFDGLVRATNATGSLSLTSNQSAAALAGQAPALQIVVSPRDAVHWALYYPFVLPGAGVDARRELPPALRDAVESLIRGDLTKAFEHLTQIPESDHNQQFYVYRAGLLLAVGRVAEARDDIKQALRVAPGSTDALALLSIAAVAQNEKDSALELARKAVERDPDSATARIALSYAQQSQFDLSGALHSLQEATERDPQNALAWARVAELWLSMGGLDRALEAAEQAVSLDPDLARTQTVLGFAYLTQIKTRESKRAFERAIALDQADPLPRLGLGLAEIRDGALEAGRKQIEIAASLDPGNALIRSYLGKAYYEEKRDKLAAREYEIATELDPLDPTPFFYDAIRKQTINRPVEALHALQESIELNDNRAVYRSRLLLDQDLAARSASLGRIYRDLGFEQLALVEGWRSVNTDPGDYSGHRFLADTYSALPRHATARVSELLQSQLLQPINITPVQPALAEANLFIAERSGPADPAFNEFTPLFERNRFALQVSGVAGGKHTFGDEVVQSGVWNRFSYSLGQFHYQSDGFRDNNDQEHNIYDVFGQVALWHKTSIQVELRSAAVEKGDLELRFDPSNFSPTLRQDQYVGFARLGFHHAFKPGSDLIASFIYRRIESEVDSPPMMNIEGVEDGYLGEAQYLFRSDRLNVIAGVGHFDAQQDDVFTTFASSSRVKDEPRHTSLYVYSHFNFLDTLSLTLGGSGDFFDDIDLNREQFNPKVGLTWCPVPGTTLRAAVFRTLQRPTLLRENTTPTIEPTQVAGFNQVFLGPIGEDAWRYGVGLDSRFSDKLYAGVEISRRDLDTPQFFVPAPPAPPIPRLERADWEEELGRAYLYWTPHPQLALSAEYLYERFEREDPFFGVEQIEELRTHRVPLGMRYFHPFGFTARIKATYVHQDGDFAVPMVPGPGTSVVSDDDQFWLVDTSVGYRLPRRYGVISLEVKNLFDADFHFQDTDPGNPTIVPDRLILFRLTASF